MYNIGNKLLRGIKNMCFGIDNDVRQGCIVGIGRRGDSGNYLASCLQMIWFCVGSRKT